jgi:fructosamine-3-kinase
MRAAARTFLIEQGLAGSDEPQAWQPLTGGVSSELWRVDLPGRSICVKGSLEKLRVPGDWHAPVSRNAVEWDWLRFAAETVPGHVPEPLAHDAERGLFAMSYLPEREYPVWKARLLAGSVHLEDAAAVGQLVGRLHAESAGDSFLATRLATDMNFDALRVGPYLRTIARRHPDLAGELAEIIRRTTTTHLALVHGDVSPKNVLIGPDGPVLLDAECAWYGDPSFDCAFVLTHLVLKTLVVSRQVEALNLSARALVDAYRDQVAWEPVEDVLARTARLLPALLLARVDGLSPVEYLDGQQRSTVREASRDLIRSGSPDLDTVVGTAIQELGRARPRRLSLSL